MQKNCTDFWTGKFGDDYTKRNVGLVNNNIEFFSYIFGQSTFKKTYSLIEFGAGSGQNIKALKHIYPGLELTAVDINESACNELRKIEGVDVVNGKVKNYGKYDIVLTKGLLIHISSEDIGQIYKTLYDSSNKYILICEYYNPTPVMVPYRGEKDKLWKRDFAGDLLDLYPDLKLIDYGFVYHRDEYLQDDLHFFLMAKC